MSTLPLFDFDDLDAGGVEPIGPRACVLRGFARPVARELLTAIDEVARAAAFRHLVTPGGYTMSVEMTNCGALGWTSDRRGYRYSPIDPQTGARWPAMPEVMARLARDAAAEAGFERFAPDACLVNRYVPGARLSLHQDKDEQDLDAPIVSVSLGMSAVFLFGGLERGDETRKVPLHHGDVVVWGAEDRLRYHGVMPLKDQPHAELGAQRLNLTFRKAG